MAPERTERVVDLNRLRRSCADCSLRMLCLPAGVPREDIGRLDEIVRARVPLDRGDALFRAGDPFASVFVIRSGSVRTARLGNEGDVQVIGFHLPGELAGLEGISDGVHHCDAVALERTSVCAVPLAQLEHVAASIPALQQQFHRIMSREIIQEHEHLMALGRRTARARVALFLHSLSERLEYAGYNGSEFRLSMSREDIASYLGLALETVSRLLTRLADDGVIAVERRRLRIVDPAALAAAAGRNAAPADGTRGYRSGG